jgi:hypothetical protein
MSDQKYELYFLDGPRRGTRITVSKPYFWFEVPAEPEFDLCNYVGLTDQVELSKPQRIRYRVKNIGGAFFGVCEASDEVFMSIVREAILRHLGDEQSIGSARLMRFSLNAEMVRDLEQWGAESFALQYGYLRGMKLKGILGTEKTGFEGIFQHEIFPLVLEGAQIPLDTNYTPPS